MKTASDTIITTLGNGLRAAIRHTSGHVAYCGMVVNAGSRDEDISRQGLAHFVEHTIFKGTRRRSSWHISNRMESIGGELNAYTTKENTAVYTVAPAGHDARAIELLADLAAEASFPENELAKEREVVIEEINSYLDSPGESVYDEFEELIFAGSGLSHNILGTPGSVRSLSGADCRAFLDRHYTPANMVVYCSTPESPEKTVRLLERHFGRLDFTGGAPERTAPPPTEPFDIVRDRNGHQAHTIIGTRLFGRNDSRRHALYLLNNYLGGPCMNSRLNQELREKRGLVYTVDSMAGLLSDTGLLLIYFGCDKDAVDRCRRLIARELDALAQATLSPLRFSRIKEQYCGQLLVNSDNKESMAMSMGKNLLFYGEPVDIGATAERVRAVTAEQLREVAELCAPALCSRLTLT